MHAARAKTAFDRGRGLVDGCMVAGQWSGRDTAYANLAAIVCNYAINCMQHNILTIYRQNGDILLKMNDFHKYKSKDVCLIYK